MSRAGGRSDEPRAVIHRRILDVADDMPDASLEAIAEEVSGASVDLVDRVLSEYGDPSEQQSEPDDGNDTDADTTSETGEEDGTHQDVPELSENQRKTLSLIAREPDATQRELAAELDVTAATVSRWVNDIPGFDWSNREAFAAGVLDDDPDDTVGSNDDPDDTVGSDDDQHDAPNSDADDRDDTPAPNADGSDEATGDAGARLDGNAENGRGRESDEGDGDSADEIADLRRRVAALEGRLEEEAGDAVTKDSGSCDDTSSDRIDTGSDRIDTGSDQIDTRLLHKVIHACLSSERITEKEEIRLLDHLLD